MPMRKLKILLVEDDRVLAEMYLDKFRQAGLEVSLAFEAREGLELALKEKPDLVVLDILLPRENGVFFLEKLRENPKIAAMPVLVFSNYDDPVVKRQAMKLGALAYLLKTNYTPKKIIEKIKSCLG